MTKFLIITSTEDIASIKIREKLLGDNLLAFEQLDTKWHDNPVFQLKKVLAKQDWGPFFHENEIYIGLTENPLIQLDDLRLSKTAIDPDFLIFASRHRSETARPAFLAHTTGNWNDKADFGGRPYEISKTSALLLRTAYLSLVFQRRIKELEEFAVDIEVTHHGPSTLEKPLIFMELGSSENEWKIDTAGLTVAHAILNTCLNYADLLKKNRPDVAIGFGGTHYAPQFKKLLDTKHFALSFICPKYFIQDLTKDMVEKMVSNTLEPIDMFLIDWKGTNSADKQHLLPILEEFDIPIKKTKEI